MLENDLHMGMFSLPMYSIPLISWLYYYVNTKNSSMHIYYIAHTVVVLLNQIPGCSKSGLFKAFSEYVIGQLGIVQKKTLLVY